jgi:D-serine deaminase-like pyridoxal phosphate-dependent protein
MSVFDSIQTPTLIVNPAIARENIRRMAAKAREQGVRFRPHFKTHQSAAIGEWFRAEGVQAITVSSLGMAEYFARHGWSDITVAFPANLREMQRISRLAREVHLGVLVESPEVARALDSALPAPVDAWIKVDVGGRRTGLAWDAAEPVRALAATLLASQKLHFRGLLTHAAQTYAANGPAEVTRVYLESIERMNRLRNILAISGIRGVELSVGDTPGTTCSPDLGRVDEIRPGNFVFFDVHQLDRGICPPDQIAVALACPVVALHPERREVVIYGGAIHLSKDVLIDGPKLDYGRLAFPIEAPGKGWSDPIPGAYLRSLSQEHGVAVIPGPEFERIRVGELLCVLPIHSCLTVTAMGKYVTLEGEVLSTLNVEK